MGFMSLFVEFINFCCMLSARFGGQGSGLGHA